MAARSMGLHFVNSVGAGGVGIGRGGSGCRGGSIIVVDIGSGKSQSSVAILA